MFGGLEVTEVSHRRHICIQYHVRLLFTEQFRYVYNRDGLRITARYSLRFATEVLRTYRKSVSCVVWLRHN